jgi:hypothetical protein
MLPAKPGERSDGFHQPRSGTLIWAPRLMALVDFIFDKLAFLEILELDSLHYRLVKKDLASVARDEPETPVRDELLDDTLRHDKNSEPKKLVMRAVPATIPRSPDFA